MRIFQVASFVDADRTSTKDTGAAASSSKDEVTWGWFARRRASVRRRRRRRRRAVAAAAAPSRVAAAAAPSLSITWLGGCGLLKPGMHYCKCKKTGTRNYITGYTCFNGKGGPACSWAGFECCKGSGCDIIALDTTCKTKER